jgi:hypothetical protein
MPSANYIRAHATPCSQHLFPSCPLLPSPHPHTGASAAGGGGPGPSLTQIKGVDDAWKMSLLGRWVNGWEAAHTAVCGRYS